MPLRAGGLDLEEELRGVGGSLSRGSASSARAPEGCAKSKVRRCCNVQGSDGVAVGNPSRVRY